MQIVEQARRGGARLAAVVALWFAFSPACARRPPPAGRALAPAGSLPEGCASVVSVDMAAVGPLGDLLHATLSPGSSSQTFVEAIDLRHEARRTTVCRYSNGPKPDFVILVSGTFRSDVLDRIAAADAHNGWPEVRAVVDGVPVLSSRGMWMAARTGIAGNELILSSQRDLLRLALTHAAVPYWIDMSAGISAVISGVEIAKRVPLTERESTFTAIREARGSWKPADGSVQMHLRVGNQAVAQSMVPAIRETLAAVTSRLSVVGGASPAPLVEAEDGARHDSRAAAL